MSARSRNPFDTNGNGPFGVRISGEQSITIRIRYSISFGNPSIRSTSSFFFYFFSHVAVVTVNIFAYESLNYAGLTFILNGFEWWLFIVCFVIFTRSGTSSRGFFFHFLAEWLGEVSEKQGCCILGIFGNEDPLFRVTIWISILWKLFIFGFRAA